MYAVKNLDVNAAPKTTTATVEILNLTPTLNRDELTTVLDFFTECSLEEVSSYFSSIEDHLGEHAPKGISIRENIISHLGYRTANEPQALTLYKYQFVKETLEKLTQMIVENSTPFLSVLHQDLQRCLLSLDIPTESDQSAINNINRILSNSKTSTSGSVNIPKEFQAFINSKLVSRGMLMDWGYDNLSFYGTDGFSRNETNEKRNNHRIEILRELISGIITIMQEFPDPLFMEFFFVCNKWLAEYPTADKAFGGKKIDKLSDELMSLVVAHWHSVRTKHQAIEAHMRSYSSVAALETFLFHDNHNSIITDEAAMAALTTYAWMVNLHRYHFKDPNAFPSRPELRSLPAPIAYRVHEKLDYLLIENAPWKRERSDLFPANALSCMGELVLLHMGNRDKINELKQYALKWCGEYDIKVGESQKPVYKEYPSAREYITRRLMKDFRDTYGDNCEGIKFWEEILSELEA